MRSTPRNERRQKSSRRGFTLRELTLAVAIGSIVMMTAVGLVHHSFDWSTLARHRRMDDQSFFRLSTDLRGDLHLAKTAMLEQRESDGDTLQLDLAGGHAVTYQIDDQLITRTESLGEDTIRRESYRFKQAKTFLFRLLESDNQIGLDVKNVTPFAESEVPQWRSFRASIGLRLRYQNGEIDS